MQEESESESNEEVGEDSRSELTSRRVGDLISREVLLTTSILIVRNAKTEQRENLRETAVFHHHSIESTNHRNSVSDETEEVDGESDRDRPLVAEIMRNRL